MAKTHDLITNGGFEKKHGWSLDDQGGSLNYFKSGVYFADNGRLIDFAERFGLAYAPPSEGHKAFYTEWDGDPGHVTLSQKANLTGAKSAVLSFDYEAAWDLKSYNAKADRTFTVEVTDRDTGKVRDFTVLVAHHDERVTDTGLQHVKLDLSEFAGDRVEVSFIWDAPGQNDGPAIFMLDDVELIGKVKGGHSPADAAETAAGPDVHVEHLPADHFLV